MMNKKKPCGLDYCPQEEIVGAYASCLACAWDNDGDNEAEEALKGADNGWHDDARRSDEYEQRTGDTDFNSNEEYDV
jgi:hypothetical protein